MLEALLHLLLHLLVVLLLHDQLLLLRSILMLRVRMVLVRSVGHRGPDTHGALRRALTHRLIGAAAALATATYRRFTHKFARPSSRILDAFRVDAASSSSANQRRGEV